MALNAKEPFKQSRKQQFEKQFNRILAVVQIQWQVVSQCQAEDLQRQENYLKNLLIVKLKWQMILPCLFSSCVRRFLPNHQGV